MRQRLVLANVGRTVPRPDLGDLTPLSGSRFPGKGVYADSSQRRRSSGQPLALALAKTAAPALKFDLIEIGNLPLYNEDLEASGAPQTWTTFGAQIRSCQAVLFVTPEYNRSVPAALKNALDVGSRPYGQSVWSGKPGAVISVSPGAIGGFGWPRPQTFEPSLLLLIVGSCVTGPAPQTPPL